MRIQMDAPIIPYEGMGGIQLYSTEEQVKPLLEGHTVKIKKFDGFIRYQH